MNAGELFSRACARFTDLVQGVPDEAWQRSTPCVGWDVRTLVNHVVGEQLWAVPLLAGQTVADVGDRFDGDLLGDDPRAAARSAAGAAIAAFAEPGALERIVSVSFGDIPAADYAMQLFADHLVHGWDLAAALGLPTDLDPDLVRRCLDWFAPIEQEYRSVGAIAARVLVPPDAGPATQLLARFGRADPWPSALATVQEFDRAFRAGNLEAVMALMSADCAFESTDPPDGRRYVGQAEVRAVWQRLFSDPGARFETEEMFEAGDRVVARWVHHWGAGAAAGADQPADQPAEHSAGAERSGFVRGIDVFRVAGGLVTEKLSYVKG